MAWVTELAATVGVHVALFSTYSAAVVAHRLQVPKLIQDGVLKCHLSAGSLEYHGESKLPRLFNEVDATSCE
jgi:hypothetical protein